MYSIIYPTITNTILN